MNGVPVVLVGGPTASGKSALAVAIAEQFSGTVINGDSMQLYGELSILTARPGDADLARAPHRLYGVLSAADACSVARWRDLALDEIEAASAAGRLAVVVGGTGLYLHALRHGLAPVPEIPDAIRQAARARHASLGGAAFHGELAARDARMADRLAPGDSQRLIRAWEVIEATGHSLADWQDQPPTADRRAAQLRFANITLLPDRVALYAACEARFDAMLDVGALDEVRALEALGLDPDLPAMKALGVPELGRHLRGESSLDEAAAAAQQATRRYAKRQLTWFRRRAPEEGRWAAQYSESILPEIFSFIRRFMLTPAR